MTVAGVANSFGAWCCCRLLLDEASLVGGGVCICDMSMLIGRACIEGVTSLFFPDRGPGEDDSLREGSTGGSGRVVEAKWLT